MMTTRHREDAAKYVRQRISNLFTDSVALLCAQYDNKSACGSVKLSYNATSPKYAGFGILKPLMKFADNLAKF